ncbi:MAG TPA: Type II secretory pathway pseudopilin PulG-like protein, partial [Verrucomicrobiae bacterium]
APKRLKEIASPALSWAMTDADQENAATGGRYYDFLPVKPTHGKVRNQLFFDWHVEAVKVSD